MWTIIKTIITLAALVSLYVAASTMEYNDMKENWTAAEEITMQEAERNAKRYELEALREALEFTDAPHERRYILAKIKELENE